ncbi:MAG: nicotinate-nucleotide--dimethylbenzimidazole phosphoribosyltransferase [Frankiales bacterium]|nr:nicotinate-nucleotide--dimethylbenzimidazole phosphoribosyltransferase [Frankiales bacterium]
MKRLVVEAPAVVAAPPRELGRLGPALAWLAGAQGSWPPVAPRRVQRVVVDKGSTRAKGQAEADRLADGGCDLLVLGAAGDQVAGLVVLAALLDLEPVQAVGTAAGGDWARLTTGVRDGLRGARMHVGDPDGLLKAVGSPPLARLTGLLAQSAVRRTPVVLAGAPLTAAAAVLAERLAPGAPAWWLAGQVPPAPAARLGLADLGLTGLLDLGLALPEGADLACTVLEQAVALSR